MKAPVLKFVVRNDIYPYPVAFWFGPQDAKAMHRWAHQHGLGNGTHIDLLESDVAACFDLGGSSLIWMDREPNKITEAGTLVHEVTHASFNAGRYLGFMPGHKSEEFYTYMNQYLVTLALAKLALHRRGSH